MTVKNLNLGFATSSLITELKRKDVLKQLALVQLQINVVKYLIQVPKQLLQVPSQPASIVMQIFLLCVFSETVLKESSGKQHRKNVVVFDPTVMFFEHKIEEVSNMSVEA